MHATKASRVNSRRSLRFALWLAAALLCANAMLARDIRAAVDDFDVVDCLLPGQIKRLGGITYMGKRRPTKTTAQACARRGGEYVLDDPANYHSALRIWLDSAEQGDAEAQYYAAEIYEQGLAAGKPDYIQAAAWYQKAAEQGDARAAVNLGRLYEQGLGVERNPVRALELYRQASGLDRAGLALLLGADSSAELAELNRQLEERDRQIEQLNTRLNDLRQQLQETQQQLQQQRAAAQQLRDQRALTRDAMQLRRMLLENAASDAERQRLQAELRQLQDDLGQREQALQQQQQRIARLQHQLGELERETQGYQQQLSASQAALEQARRQPPPASTPPPVIELVDPPLPGDRNRLRLPLSEVRDRQLGGRVFAPAGLKSLSANGAPLQTDGNGLFTARLPQLRGSDDDLHLQLLAVDRLDREFSLTLVISAASGARLQSPPLAAGQTDAIFGRYFALVIGNDAYQNWGPLANAVNDARAVADVLQQRYGYRVTTLFNASRSDILSQINKLRQQLTEQDNLLIYYAGHGHLEQDLDRGYWIPVDARLDDTTQWLHIDAITDQLKIMSAKHVLIVADSCYAGKLTRASLARLKPGLSESRRQQMLKEFARARVRTALTSGGVQPVHDSGGSGHSIFTRALLDALRSNNSLLEAERLFLAIQTRVANATEKLRIRQVPTYDPIHLAGHVSGDFVFVPRP